MYLLIKEPVCDTVDDKRLTDFKTPLRLRAGGVIITSARTLCNHLGLYVCMCVYVCLSVNTITQKIINIWTSHFAHTFAIA